MVGSVGMKAVLVILFAGCVSLHGLGDELVPDAFIDVRTIARDIQLEMRYVTDDNFCLLYTSPSPRDCQ